MKIKSVVIADDHPIIRKAVKDILKTTSFRISGEANHGIELLALIKKSIPDIAIIDLEMPKMDGHETILELHTTYPQIKLIAFSGFLDIHNQQKAIENGVDATISKADSSRNLIAALDAVMQGKKYHSKVSSQFYIPPLKIKNHVILTHREEQILTMISDGKTSKQIGETYNISPWTVNKHRSNIREKLGLNNLAAVVRYAVDNSYNSK